MSLRAEITTTVCAVSCALGIGYMMQKGEVAELRYGGAGHGLVASGYFVGEPAEIASNTLQPGLDEHALSAVQMEMTSVEISVRTETGSVAESLEEIDPRITNCDDLQSDCDAIGASPSPQINLSGVLAD